MKTIEDKDFNVLFEYANLRIDHDTSLAEGSGRHSVLKSLVEKAELENKDLLGNEQAKVIVRAIVQTVQLVTKKCNEESKHQQNMTNELQSEIYHNKAIHDRMISELQEELENTTQQLVEANSKVAFLEPTPAKQQRTLLFIGYYSYALVLLCVAYVMYWGISVSPDISVEINVGELIGGSLVGIGAALAGGAYAIKTLGNSEKPND